MAATVKQIIEATLHKMVVLDPHEAAPQYLISRGQENLRQMLESWSTQSLYIDAYAHESFQLSGNKRYYTIGDGANFDTTRPMSIEHARVEDASGTEYRVEVVPFDIWAELEWKDTQQTVPDYLYYEPTSPDGEIRLSQLPIDGHHLHLISLKPLQDVPKLNASFSFPPGYERAMILGLYLEMAPEFGIEVPQTVLRNAQDAIRGLKRANARYRTRTLRTDPGISGPNQRYDVNRGPGVQ